VARIWLALIFSCVWPFATVADVALSIGYLKVETARTASLSTVNTTPADAGLAGARLGLEDNRTTGKFLGQTFDLIESVVPVGDDPLAAARPLLKESEALLVDAPAEVLLAIADLPEAKGKIVFNVTAGDTALRDRQCRANILHTAASDLMLADALMQFLSAKRWTRIALMAGPRPGDDAMVNALTRAAAKFQLRIADTLVWDVDADMRRNAAQEVPLLTQNLGRHDVLMVVDTADDFGRYIPYNTWEAKPIVGTEGLSPRGWSPVVEQWGAAQLQNRFRTLAQRDMRADDYAAWAAIRSLGEAVTRTGAADAESLLSYMLSNAFELGGFKGRALGFRPWNGQMRQPIPLVTDRAVVATAPLPGFLHQRTELDTLGLDQPESSCAAF
jgi:ABC transporter substrate binding protein (PQQ-dependent alcohol dehydrogenase system)